MGLAIAAVSCVSVVICVFHAEDSLFSRLSSVTTGFSPVISDKLILYSLMKGVFDMSELILTQENFDREVLRLDKPVLVDFWADWCGPCRALAPVIDELAQEFDGVSRVGKVNVDEQPALAGRYGIGSIPTVMLFKNGAAVQTVVGARSKAELAALLRASDGR